MNKKEAEDYIYQSYLNGQIHWDYDSPDSLKRTPELSKEIIRELSGTPAVVITGSKGKGSVASMISGILQTKYKVGLFTSPHISDFCERFRVNGHIISNAEFISQIEDLKIRFDGIERNLPPDKCISPIGIQTALALAFFQSKSTDFNVLECGKGARYDDVTNVTHSYAVINTIFLEHTRELGKTLEEIAYDKSHVITEDTKYVFVGPQVPEVMKIIEKRAEKLGVAVISYGRDFVCSNIKYADSGMEFDVELGNEIYSGLKLPLLGEHQALNAALSIACCKQIDKNLDIQDIKEAMLKLQWPGRQHILSQKPFILLDACINSASALQVKKTLGYLGITKITLIVGIPEDKDYAGVVWEMKGITDKVILTQSHNTHYRFSSNQVDKLEFMGIKAEWEGTIQGALQKALNLGNPTVILGTTSLISEVLS